MMIKKQAAALAAMALVAGGAQAVALSGTNESLGNSSVFFVAIDINANAGLVLDLGLQMADFTNVASASLPQGSWNFASNTSTFAGVTGNSWSAAYDTFKAAQSGGDYRWAVYAGDSITGAVSATNTIAGRGLLATGTPTVTQMTSTSGISSNNVGTMLTNFNNHVINARNRGTLTTANNGAANTDSSMSNAWLDASTMKSNFGGLLTWSYLSANGATTNFQWIQNLTNNPTVTQLGLVNATDSLAATPLTFTFDIATNTLVAAVPEPGTYAMLLAGIAALGFVARRRQA